MTLSDIMEDRYDENGIRHWRLKSNPSVKYNDQYDNIFAGHNIDSVRKHTICPFDNKPCDYRIIVPADPMDGYHMRWCRHNHRFNMNDSPPCGKNFNRKKKAAKPKTKRKKCRCKK